MKKSKATWFLVLPLITSSALPLLGHADEVLVYTAQQNNHIRVLAASCAACHGTLGNAIESKSSRQTDENNAVLAGIDPADFISKMLGFKDGTRKATVMHHHAKGLTVDEINQLAVHFSQQKRTVAMPLTSQVLNATHD
jgi:cytochrome c553